MLYAHSGDRYSEKRCYTFEQLSIAKVAKSCTFEQLSLAKVAKRSLDPVVGITTLINDVFLIFIYLRVVIALELVQ